MDIKELIAKDESAKLDFKREWYKEADLKTELIKDIIALTNGDIHTIGQSSFLIIGVKENSNENVYHDVKLDKTLDEIKKQLLQNLQNLATPSIQNIQMEFFEVDSKNILVIQIPFHPYLIILKDKIRQYKKDDFLYRAGEETVVANFDTRTAFVEAINKYKQSNSIIPFPVKITNEEPKKENKPLKVMSEIDKFNYKTTSFINKRNSEINFDDLNWELIEEYIKRKEYDIDLSLDRELILSKLKFLKHGAILNGVILNFAKRPDTFISQAHVVIINKKSNTKRFYGSNIKLWKKY